MSDFKKSEYPGGKPSFSHSALETYNKCSELYRLFYLDAATRRPQMGRFDKQVGIVVHLVMEAYYARAIIDGKEKGTPPGELGSVKPQLDKYWSQYFLSIGAPRLAGLIRDCLTDHTILLEKADKDYTGQDAIRTADGRVSKSPTMTQAWKSQAAALGIDKRKALIDATVEKLDSGYNGISCMDVYNESYKILEQYVHPTAIAEIESLEKFLAGVRYPDTGKSLTGKIDLIGRTSDGFRIIVDHKSASRTHKDSFKVAANDQLLKYGWADYKMTDRVPEYIGINFLRSNTLVAGLFDMEQAEEAIKRSEQTILAILKGVFIKRSPSDFGTPCVSLDNKTRCPYLAHCFPKYAQSLRELERR